MLLAYFRQLNDNFFNILARPSLLWTLFMLSDKADLVILVIVAFKAILMVFYVGCKRTCKSSPCLVQCH